jgi:hypothetical protein
MTPTALKEAAQVGFPRDKIVGNVTTCTEQEMVPAGEAARGFICVSLFATGTDFPLIQDVLKYSNSRSVLRIVYGLCWKPPAEPFDPYFSLLSQPIQRVLMPDSVPSPCLLSFRWSVATAMAYSKRPWHQNMDRFGVEGSD